MWRIITAALLLSGCVTNQAEWVTREYSPKKGGSLKYYDDGGEFAFVVEQVKEDATQKMRDFCAPESYSVTRETNQREVHGAVVIGVVAATTDRVPTVVSFECVSH